jgi:hypothetical protein
MIAQTFDPYHFNQKAPRIRAQAAAVLRKWGLLPRFKRWRLTQDPDTGMVVLFGILNNKYIATHTSTPFSDYFDPRLLHDLANELQVQVVSCNSDGLRYAFILERGQADVLPTHIDYPFLDGDQLFARVVYGKKPAPDMPEPQTLVIAADIVDDQTLVDRGVGAFLKVFDDIKLKDDAAVQNRPKIVVIDTDEFEKRVAEHEANRQRSQHIKELFDTTAG